MNTEPATTCYDCGKVGAPGERWYVCDLCEDCRYEHARARDAESRKGKPK